MRTLTRFILLVAGLCAGALAHAQAATPAPAKAPASASPATLSPEVLVRTITDDVLAAILSDKDLQAGDRAKALDLAEKKILPHVDFEQATRLALGRGWNSATPPQRTRLVDEFRTLLVRTYANSIGTYQGQTMRVQPVRMAPTDTDVTVRNSFISPGRAPVSVDYAMRRGTAGWKIYDISVEGVSLVITYRSQFDSIVRNGGIDGLIKRLAELNNRSRES
ncbi:MAG TPA: ABC transporter substrate-binding protein [Burkholderiales bacterium]